MVEHVGPDEHPLEHPRGLVVGEQVRGQMRDRRPGGGPLVEPSAIRVACHNSSVVAIVAISARIRSASPRWLPRSEPGAAPCGSTAHRPPRPAPAREHVDQQRVPALMTQPRERRVLVDDADHRDHDRRGGREAPEDEGVHQPRAQPLQQLALAEHDRRLVARSGACVAGALDRRRRTSSVNRKRHAGVNSAPLTASAAASRTAETGDASAPRLPDLGRDRRHDLVQVADHGVVGGGEDRRLAVGVDRHQPLGALAAGHGWVAPLIPQAM